jgi:hypothetical protein
MADVLLVHVREDETLADSVGISLERSGLTVARGESVFDVGDEVPCVVVLWSDVSTRSSMVRDVAIRAQREGKLVAATLGGCETPLGFSRPAPHDLTEWGGDPDDPILDPVFFAADRLVCAAKLGGPKPQRPTQPYAMRPAPQERIERPRADEPEYEDLPRAPLPRARAPEPQQIDDDEEERAPAPVRAPAPQSAVGETRQMPPNLAAETLAWKQIENSNNPQDFLDYLGHYGPKGLFSELASMKLDKLTKKPAPAKAGSFIQHKPAPHVDAKRRPAPAPEKPAARREPERPAPRRESERPAMRAEPMRKAEPPRAAPRPVPPPSRPDRPMSRLTEIERPPEAAAPRTRVAAAARRRAPVAAESRRASAMSEERRGFPWGALVVVFVLAGGGIAVFQNLPKGDAKADSPPGFAEAMRAAPAPGDYAAVADEEPTLDATSLAEAAKPAQAKPQKQQVARHESARNEGIGGPIMPVTARDSGGGSARKEATKDATPPPAIAFRAIEPSAPAAPAPAAVQPEVAALDPVPAAPQVRYVQARWIKQPGPTVLSRYYPQAAYDAGRKGSATLDCAIMQSGRLNCVVQSETPAGQGFGQAAVAAAQSYLASPQAADGSLAYGQRTRLTIRFQ